MSSSKSSAVVQSRWIPAMSMRGLLPGVLLAAVICGAAFSMRGLPGLTIFSPMILAVVIGIVFANVVDTPSHAKSGIGFCQRTLLRTAIVLLGFQVTAGQVMSIGLSGVGVVVVALVATFAFTLGLARLLGVERKLAELIAAGTSICGASAIVAANSVTAARDEDVAYAVASITLFGTIAMFAFPLLAPVVGLGPHDYGLWAGSAIHEVAQVIGAGFQNGAESGEISTVSKLARVVMLAPVVISLGHFARRHSQSGGAAKAPTPWFVFGFVAVVALNSLVDLPAWLTSAMALTTTLLLTMGLAAMGLRTNISDIRSRGLRPLLLALSASLFIAGLSLALIKLS